MYGCKPVTHTRTCQCGATVTVTGTIGPCNMCDACAAGLLKIIFSQAPEDIFPLDQPVPPSCGLRRDLPKAERRHQRVYLGTDTRHAGDGGFEDLHVYACARCGRDQQTRTPPA